MIVDLRPWVIVRTGIRKEAKAYSLLVERYGVEAWLPQTPCFSRAHRKVKHRREWWKPVMATVFFARVTANDLYRWRLVEDMRIEKNGSVLPINISPIELGAFRKAIEQENREIMRQGQRLASSTPPKVRKPRPSNRIPKGRPSVKPGREAERLHSWLLKAGVDPKAKAVKAKKEEAAA